MKVKCDVYKDILQKEKTKMKCIACGKKRKIYDNNVCKKCFDSNKEWKRKIWRR